MHLDKKYFFLGTSLFFKLLINVFVVFYIAKMVNVEEFGSFSLAFIISSIATLCLDYGFNLKSLILTSKTRKEINDELASMILSKLILTGFFGLIFLIFYFMSTYESNTKEVITILVFSAIPASFGNFYLNNFKIINRFEKEAIGYIIQGSSLIVLLGINHFLGSNNIVNYAIILLIARLSYMIFGYWIFTKVFFKSFSLDFKKALYGIKVATPFGIHLILGASIIYIDTFILSFLSSLEDVGLYQAGMRIIMASMLIAVIISDAYIPEISKIHRNIAFVSKKLSNLFQFILFFSLLTITLIYFYQSTIINLLFSQDYQPIKQSIFYILSIIFLRYIGIVPGIILTTFNKQSVRANAVFISIIISIIFNLILIPIYGIKGAFLASLIAHVILNTIYVYSALKNIYFLNMSCYVALVVLLIINFLVQLYLFKDSLTYLLITGVMYMILLGIYYIMLLNTKVSK